MCSAGDGAGEGNAVKVTLDNPSLHRRDAFTEQWLRSPRILILSSSAVPGTPFGVQLSVKRPLPSAVRARAR